MSLRMSCHIAVSPIKRERTLPAAVCELKDVLFAKSCGNMNQKQKKLSKCTVLCKTLRLTCYMRLLYMLGTFASSLTS